MKYPSKVVLQVWTWAATMVVGQAFAAPLQDPSKQTAPPAKATTTIQQTTNERNSAAVIIGGGLQLAPAPDLVGAITSAGGSLQFTVTNIGSITAVASRAAVSCHPVAIGHPRCPLNVEGVYDASIPYDPFVPDSIGGAFMDVPSLNPGQTYKFDLNSFNKALPLAQWPSGPYKVNIWVDSGRQVKEMNENNNEASIIWVH